MLLAAGLAFGLFFMRPMSYAASDRPSIQHGLKVLAFALLFTLVYGAMGFYLLDRHFNSSYNLWAAVRQTLVMFAQFYDPGLVSTTLLGRYFANSIYIVGASTLGYAFLMILRPVLVHNPATREERDKARTIVQAHGCSSLARYTLFDDKSYYFSQGGSLIAYVVKGRIALALGDPIGPEGDFSVCLAGFRDMCTVNDWQPAFYQTLPDHLEQYRSSGYDTLCIGQEAIINLAEFTLDGKSGKCIRNLYNHVKRLGYGVEMYQPPLNENLISELHSVSDEWLTMVHGTEMTFSLGRFEE